MILNSTRALSLVGIFIFLAEYSHADTFCSKLMSVPNNINYTDLMSVIAMKTPVMTPTKKETNLGARYSVQVFPLSEDVQAKIMLAIKDDKEVCLTGSVSVRAPVDSGAINGNSIIGYPLIWQFFVYKVEPMLP